MSSEENKSKSEEINGFNYQNLKIISPSTIIKEENPSNETQAKHELTPSKISEQKNVNSSILNSNNKEINPPIKFHSVTSDLNSTINENKKLNFFKSKKVTLFDKKENLEKICCNCTKTKCIKKYCECFANNRYCKDCNCIDCMNKFIYSNNNNNNNNSSKELSENEDIYCTCAKINCNKKYCECYKLGKKCNDKCRCVNCLNSSYPIFNINNKDNLNNSNANIDDNNNSKKNNINDLSVNKANIELDEKKSSSRKSSSSDDDDEDTYKIQRVSIFINQYQTLVNVEKFTKEDMMLISKKRYNSE